MKPTKVIAIIGAMIAIVLIIYLVIAFANASAWNRLEQSSPTVTVDIKANND